MSKATVAYESRRIARRQTAYEKKVIACLVKLGRNREAAECEVDRAHDQVMRAEKVGVEPKVEAAILDATMHHAHPHHVVVSEDSGPGLHPGILREQVEQRQRERQATESPTRDEWEVVVRRPSDAQRLEILRAHPSGRVIGSNVVISGYHDDEKAAHAAHDITRRYRLVVTFGPRAQMAAEYGAEGDRSAMGEGTAYEARDSGAGPFTRIERDPARFAVVKERADAIGPIESERELYELLVPDLEKETQEVFYVVAVDVHGQLLEYAEVARGQVDRVAVTPQEILPVVLLAKASGFAVAHNHPSGSARPSDADKQLTKLVRQASEVACPGVRFMDHLVVTGSEYYSFAEKKLTRVRRA